jgi:CRISPR-associated protein Csd1
MAWIEKLHATYEACKATHSLMPISHTPQQIQIEISIDNHGNFKGAKTVQKEEIFIPATKKSASRTANEAPHALCDKIQYCAADYVKYGGAKTPYFPSYEAQLSQWCSSEFTHEKAQAVLSYVRKGQLVADLLGEKILHRGEDGKLLTNWLSETDTPEIFRMLTAKEGERDQGDAFIRWQVRCPDDPNSAVWLDTSLQRAWINYESSVEAIGGLCMATGEQNTTLALSHSRRIRHAADGAKIISANDEDGFTFRGRFTDKEGLQVCSISSEVSQKAHTALRWLVNRQAWKNGDQVIVTWAVAGKPVPDPIQNTLALILGIEVPVQAELPMLASDVGQAFALRLKSAIAGYRAKLDPTDDIVIMGLDSTLKGKGRIAITYYRELKGSEFLDRIERWHAQCAWPQNFGKNLPFVGAPAPRDIAEAAFGNQLDGKSGEKLCKATVERLLPCIVDGQTLPHDLVLSTARRAANRFGLPRKNRDGKVFEDEWEKCLGIACALFRGYSTSQGKEYQMALEEERLTRDYLYGRLLAVADSVESFALTKAETNRDTTAARLMQRFADRPFSTWRNIELSLTPYKSRLKSSEKGAGFLWKREKLLDEIQCRFQGDDFTDDHALSAEFLLGFHCQRMALRAGTPAANDEQASNN